MKTIFSNTKRNVLTMTLLAALALPMVSCSNDDDNVSEPPVNQNPIQDPLRGYLYAAEFTKAVPAKNAGNYEFGIVFTPTVNGKIKAITAIIPDIHAGMKVSYHLGLRCQNCIKNRNN